MTEFFSNLLKPYVVCAVVGQALCVLVLFFMTRKRAFVRSHAVPCYIYNIIGLLLGAHILFFLVGLPDFIKEYAGKITDFQTFFDAVGSSSSGMVFYGGLFGAMLATVIYCKTHYVPLRPLLNTASVLYPLFHAFGRIGCTLTGCCYGIEYHGPLAIQYSESQAVAGISDHIADFTRFPVQPLEALCELIIFAVLLTLYLKTESRFSLAAIYILVYGIVRFSDEFLRGDEIRGLWGPFSTSQWIALVSVICVIIYFIVTGKKKAATHIA